MLPLIAAGASILGGLFGRGGNPNEFAKGEAEKYKRMGQSYLDPNNPFYATQTNAYFRNLTRTLNQSSPTKDSFMSMMLAGGRSDGAATSVANAQTEAIQARNRDTASGSAEQFNTNMVGQGMNFAGRMFDNSAQMYTLYGQGKMAQTDDQNNFASSLLDLGAGILGNEFGKTGTSNPVTHSFDPNNTKAIPWDAINKFKFGRG